MRNYHAEKYRMYVLQRILQYAKADLQGGGNPILALDGHGDIIDNSETKGEALERSYAKATKQGQVIHTVVQHHDNFGESSGSMVTDRGRYCGVISSYKVVNSDSMRHYFLDMSMNLYLQTQISTHVSMITCHRSR